MAAGAKMYTKKRRYGSKPAAATLNVTADVISR